MVMKCLFCDNDAKKVLMCNMCMCDIEKVKELTKVMKEYMENALGVRA